MDKSESIVKIAAALNRAQKKIGGAVKGAANPFFKSKYANLNSVMEACKDALNDEGITCLQPIVSDTNGDYVDTILLHESGEFISARMKIIIAKEDMQAYGSATSYARRYGLQSMMFIPAEDDDGEATMGRSKSAYSAPAKPAAPVAPATVAQAAEVVAKAVTEEKTAAPAKSSFRKPAAKPSPVEAASVDMPEGWE